MWHLTSAEGETLRKVFDGPRVRLFRVLLSALAADRKGLAAERQCFIFLNGLVMTRPEVMIPQAHNKFDAAGKLTDQATRDFLTAHLAALKAWVLRLR